MATTHKRKPSTPRMAKDLLKQLPDRVRIGAYSFKLVIGIPQKEGVITWGACNVALQTIFLHDYWTSLSNLGQTLVHEIYHALWWAQGLGDHGEQEERVVDLMASGWCQVYRDNPWLSSWLDECVAFDRNEVPYVAEKHLLKKINRKQRKLPFGFTPKFDPK